MTRNWKSRAGGKSCVWLSPLSDQLSFLWHKESFWCALIHDFSILRAGCERAALCAESAEKSTTHMSSCIAHASAGQQTSSSSEDTTVCRTSLDSCYPVKRTSPNRGTLPHLLLYQGCAEHWINLDLLRDQLLWHSSPRAFSLLPAQHCLWGFDGGSPVKS